MHGSLESEIMQKVALINEDPILWEEYQNFIEYKTNLRNVVQNEYKELFF